MATRKSNSTTEAAAKGLGLTLQSGNENEYPLAYVRSLWDVATNSQKENLVSLLGGNEGQYSQEEINKAIADKLADIGTNMGKLESAGTYRSYQAGDPFPDTATLAEAEANKGDYALVEVKGTGDDSETTVAFDRYHKTADGWVKDYRIDLSQFNSTEITSLVGGNIDSVLMQKLSDLPTAALLNTTIQGLDGRISTVEGMIPSQASSTNQLADKEFVNSSITTNTATYRGLFESVAGLPTKAQVATLKDNDYAFVHDLSTSESGNPSYVRYKYVENNETATFKIGNDTYERTSSEDTNTGSPNNYPLYAFHKQGATGSGNTLFSLSKVITEGITLYSSASDSIGTKPTITNITNTPAWVEEYTLNNSSFTAAQWAALNSGVTSAQQQYVAGLMQKDLQDKANALLTATTTIDSGGTYYTDEEASHDMVVKVELKYNKVAVDAKSTPSGWTKVQDQTGVYTKTVTSTGAAASVAAQEFQYDVPSGTYAGITAKKSSTKKDLTIITPFYYGFSSNGAPSSDSDYAAIVESLTRYDAASKVSGTSSPVITSVPGSGNKYFYIVVASGRSATAVQPGAGDVLVNPSTGNANVSTHSFASPQSGGPTLSNYKVYRSVNSFTGGTTISDLTVTVN